MQDRQETAGRALLSAHQVQNLLHVDRSTVYRMAEDGRLPAIKVGRQWRFPAARIEAFVAGAREQERAAGADDIRAAGPRRPAAGTPDVLDLAVASAVIEVAAELLGVMMVVTDMNGRPLTQVSNPCPWFAERLDDPRLLQNCAQEWQQLADDVDLESRFHTGRLGFQCARAFVRSGTSLVGMVLVGGIAPQIPESEAAEADGTSTAHDGLYQLNPAHRRRVLSALPRVAAALSRVQSRSERAEVSHDGAKPGHSSTAPETGAAPTPTTERNEP
jgi:excisionase family DNA binding protein